MTEENQKQVQSPKSPKEIPSPTEPETSTSILGKTKTESQDVYKRVYETHKQQSQTSKGNNKNKAKDGKPLTVETDAYPILISGDVPYSRSDLFNFENKLRDIVQELTKPVYEKCTDTLRKLG